MEDMITNDGPFNGAAIRELTDPPPPGTMINLSPADILREFSKLQPFDLTTSSWPDYAEHLEEYFELYNIPRNKRVRILIDRISNATYEKLREICKPVAPLDKSYEELMEIMEKNFNKYSNKFRERVKFTRRVQRAHESILKYATALKKWSKNCKFPEPWWQEALVSQFINGIRSDLIRMKLFELGVDDFDQIVDFACNMESMQDSIKSAIDDAAEAAVSKIAEKESVQAQTSVVEKLGESSNVVVCFSCFEPGHKTSACELGKWKTAAPEAQATKDNAANKNPSTGTSLNQLSNQSKNQPATKYQPVNKNQPTYPTKNQVKKQGANQFKFQSKNQFKNRNKSQFKKPPANFGGQPVGQYGNDFQNLLRNQFKDLDKKEYSNQNYTNRSVSSTYQPNTSLFYR